MRVLFLPHESGRTGLVVCVVDDMMFVHGLGWMRGLMTNKERWAAQGTMTQCELRFV